MAQKFDYAAVLLETVDNKLLFHHRDNKPNIANPNKIGFFGGGIDRNETPISAAIREIKEELNLLTNNIGVKNEENDRTICYQLSKGGYLRSIYYLGCACFSY